MFFAMTEHAKIIFKMGETGFLVKEFTDTTMTGIRALKAKIGQLNDPTNCDAIIRLIQENIHTSTGIVGVELPDEPNVRNVVVNKLPALKRAA